VDPENEVRYYNAVHEVSVVQINRVETFLLGTAYTINLSLRTLKGATELRRAKLGRPPGAADPAWYPYLS
jgi:hypothetical protein